MLSGACSRADDGCGQGAPGQCVYHRSRRVWPCCHRYCIFDGAQVYATDVRPEVADQVESLGGTFVEIPVRQKSTDGYAKEMTGDEQARVRQVYAEQAAKSDIIITTAQVPGRPSPLLLDEEAIAGMRPGSVIVDLGASELGSNTALTVPDEMIRTDNDVTIIGYRNLPDKLPEQASQLFGNNVVNLFKLLTPQRTAKLFSMRMTRSSEQ